LTLAPTTERIGAMVGKTIAALAVAVALAATAHAAAPKPWQWTPATASRAVVAAPLALWPSASGDNGDVTSAKCTGRGRATQGRFNSFRCTARFVFKTSGTPPRTSVLWASIRPVGKGQVCASLSSLAEIADCVSTAGPPRKLGSTAQAQLALRQAMTARMGTSGPWSAAMQCLGFGAGFFVCNFDNPSERGSATVITTTRGPRVTVTAIECLQQTERPGCRLP
jgi:hypothetical protein